MKKEYIGDIVFMLIPETDDERREAFVMNIHGGFMGDRGQWFFTSPAKKNVKWMRKNFLLLSPADQQELIEGKFWLGTAKTGGIRGGNNMTSSHWSGCFRQQEIHLVAKEMIGARKAKAGEHPATASVCTGGGFSGWWAHELFNNPADGEIPEKVMPETLALLSYNWTL